MLKNRLNITTQRELNREEERITKLKARWLFDSGTLDQIEVGTYKGLSEIHRTLFEDIYEFAGMIRDVNIAKDDFRFAPVMYLEYALKNIDKMLQSNFDEIEKKYVEMNIAHPFREGNGRVTRIWLDMIFKKVMGKIVDWNVIDKDDYLQAMRRSPIRDIEIKHLLKNALTDDLSRESFMKGIDASYYYEGYSEFRTEELE